VAGASAGVVGEALRFRAISKTQTQARHQVCACMDFHTNNWNDLNWHDQDAINKHTYTHTHTHTLTHSHTRTIMKTLTHTFSLAHTSTLKHALSLSLSLSLSPSLSLSVALWLSRYFFSFLPLSCSLSCFFDLYESHAILHTHAHPLSLSLSRRFSCVSLSLVLGYCLSVFLSLYLSLCFSRIHTHSLSFLSPLSFSPFLLHAHFLFSLSLPLSLTHTLPFPPSLPPLSFSLSLSYVGSGWRRVPRLVWRASANG